MRQSPINFDTNNLIVEHNNISITAEGTDISSGSIDNTNTYELKCTYTGGYVNYTSPTETSQWNLAQFHFHAPAEHTIDNQQYDLCMHNVFIKNGTTDNYLVLGILWELDANTEDDSFITSLNLTGVSGAANSVSNVSLSSLYDWTNSQQKFNYQGGLTTPG